mgnify:CR=1 FL=1
MYQKELYSEVNFKEYSEELIQQIKYTHNNNQAIDIQYDIEPVILPLDLTIPLSLIVTEIVSNSFKHAFKEQNEGKIMVELKEIAPKKYQLVILSELDNTAMSQHIVMESFTPAWWTCISFVIGIIILLLLLPTGFHR